jgi:hypothetical protein
VWREAGRDRRTPCRRALRLRGTPVSSLCSRRVSLSIYALFPPAPSLFAPGEGRTIVACTLIPPPAPCAGVSVARGTARTQSASGTLSFVYGRLSFSVDSCDHDEPQRFDVTLRVWQAHTPHGVGCGICRVAYLMGLTERAAWPSVAVCACVRCGSSVELEVCPCSPNRDHGIICACSFETVHT